LETLKVGGTLCTSLEALQRVCERCTDPSVPASVASSKTRERDFRDAERELDEAGV
jgi:hypothetical protein